ncbi:hypothetical protein EGI22_10740 [Lacihabitans sp. LS3-19]|uniref:site-2 protease family protein n=1 Tax=Lacihabitans sp. LS3-19 TaxID=2487335 RepID=UPI0020CE9828|nr:site-2 protease family protein [Lacihabitans sp. LS3-19]MCP9768390.1 hypothetical protein [Lacihabitans sp. LS3-19]
MNLKKVIGFALMLAVGGFVGFFVGKFLVKEALDGLTKNHLFGLLALLIPIFFFVIGFHELGHAFLGKIVGFEFKMYVVGPLLIEKNQSGIDIKLNKNFNLFGGLVISLPTNSENLKNRFSWYAAGGPLFSLLLVLLAIAIIYAIPSDFIFLILLCKMTAFFSGLIFVATMIPIKSGGFHTDGARILRLQTKGEIADLEVMTLSIIAKTSSNLRPRDLEIEEVKTAMTLAAKHKDTYEVYLIGYLFQAQFDKGLISEAKETLDIYLEKIVQVPVALQGSVWLDASFFYGYALNDLEKAKDYFALFKPNNFIPKAQILITEAMISILEKQKVNALDKVALAEKELKNMIDQGLAEAYNDRLADMKNRISEF